MLLFYKVSVEEPVITENCEAISINQIENRNYFVVWNCSQLLRLSGYCKLVFKDPGDNYQICAKAKQNNVSDHSYGFEFIEGNSSSSYKVMV